MISASSLKLVAVVALVAGCEAGAREPGAREPTSAPAATVTLTSVAFADDCGGSPPERPPITAGGPGVPAKSAAAPAVMSPPADGPAGSRRCEQTSMQLSITATRATDVRVKSVEVFDERGASLGVLASRAPTRWSDAQAMYQPWDEKVGAGQTALVSYVLGQPSFVSNYDERDRTYTVKVLASVGGVDQPLQTTVMVVARPAPVPT